MLSFPGGERWLVDCGRQAPDQLWEAGFNWHEIDGQIVTHVHGDHIFGLEDFAFQRFYQGSPNSDIASIMLGGPRPGFLAHSAVRSEVWESLAASLRYLKIGDDPRAGKLESYFEVLVPVASEPPAENAWNHSETFECNGYRIVARETEHVPGKPSCSLEIELGDQDQIAWWSGDCTVDADFLCSIEPRTTIFFHDCTFTDYPGQVHGAFTLLEKLPERVRSKMVLMHHEDDIEAHRELVERLGFRISLPDQVYNLNTGKLV